VAYAAFTQDFPITIYLSYEYYNYATRVNHGANLEQDRRNARKTDAGV
jgi:hypothetical protein